LFLKDVKASPESVVAKNNLLFINQFLINLTGCKTFDKAFYCKFT
jgi:hypothetical protein